MYIYISLKYYLNKETNKYNIYIYALAYVVDVCIYLKCFHHTLFSIELMHIHARAHTHKLLRHLSGGSGAKRSGLRNGVASGPGAASTWLLGLQSKRGQRAPVRRTRKASSTLLRHPSQLASCWR